MIDTRAGLTGLRLSNTRHEKEEAALQHKRGTAQNSHRATSSAYETKVEA